MEGCFIIAKYLEIKVLGGEVDAVDNTVVKDVDVASVHITSAQR